MFKFEGIWRSVREFFTLTHAERLIHRLSVGDRIELRARLQKAVQLMHEAEHAEPISRRVEMAIAALRILVVAVAAAQLKQRSEIPVDWPDLAQAREVVMELGGMQRHLHALAPVFHEGFAYPSEREYGALKKLFIKLESYIDVRTPRDLLVARTGRVTGSLALVALLCWLAIAPRNLAYGKPVTASSTCSETPTARVGMPRLGRLVDGVRGERKFAICTEKQQGVWVSIDLEETHKIDRVAVFPRTDMLWNWTTDDIPVRLELSLDGKQFEVVATKTTPLATDLPWYQSVHGKRARYVRLMGAAQRPQQFYLSEVEVYGR